MMTRREELAWLAGFFDGEGHMACRWVKGKVRLDGGRPQHRSLVFCLAQRNPEVLERARDILGFGDVYKVKHRDSHTYTYRVHSFEKCQAAAAMILQFVGPVKKAQICEALKQYQDRAGEAVGASA